MQLYRRLLKYVRPYTPQVVGAFLCTILVTAATLSISPLVGFTFQSIENKSFFWLNLSALGVIGIFLLKGIVSYGQEFLSYYVTNRVIVDLRNKFYEHLQSLSLDFYARWHTGEIVSRVMNDIATLQTVLFTSFTTLVPHTLLLLGLIGYIFYLNWKLSLFTFIALPLIVHVIRIFAQELREISEGVQQKTADITSHLEETISQIKVVKSFSMEKKEQAKFEKETEKSFHISMRAVQILATQNPIIALLQTIAVVAIVWYGGLEIINGQLSLPQLISFATALAIMTDPGNTLSKAYSIVQQGMGATKRIFEVLDIQPTIKEDKQAIVLPKVRGQVEYRNVNFSYNNNSELALKDINLVVEPGQLVALVGRTGAGKSTLASLLLRFYDPGSGSILIDGHDIKSVTINSLRRQIAVVPQETTLFRGTIHENIAYGDPTASKEAIVSAAITANIHAFIETLPDKYETLVGERGSTLSGGERQRIAIARAILRDPRILILDEATSSLDAETESLIREALQRLTQGRTTFVIAHRLYTVEKADRIVVVDNKMIVETGTHQELLAQNGLYKHFYAMQFQN